MLYIVLNSWISENQSWPDSVVSCRNREELLVINSPELLDAEDRCKVFFRAESAGAEGGEGCGTFLFLGCKNPSEQEIYDTKALLPILAEGGCLVGHDRNWQVAVCPCNKHIKADILSEMFELHRKHVAMVPCGIPPSMFLTLESGDIYVSRRRTKVRWTTLHGLDKGYRP
jgi:hypothetical protein